MFLDWDKIKEHAKAHGLEPALVGAFVAVESGGIPERTRYERHWSFFHHPTNEIAAALGITEQTEMMAQAHSYGYMQVMGATARDLGFMGYLHTLCQPDLGLEYGCRFLVKKRGQYPELKDLVASYNAGTPRKGDDNRYKNQEYVDLVLQKYETFKGEGHG